MQIRNKGGDCAGVVRSNNQFEGPASIRPYVPSESSPMGNIRPAREACRRPTPPGDGSPTAVPRKAKIYQTAEIAVGSLAIPQER
jgi:hypothetical protein